MRNFLLSIAVIALGLAAAQTLPRRPQTPAKSPQVTQGSLFYFDIKGRPAGLCPLKRTAVQAEISGPLARVTVTQQFVNPSTEKIEAVYTFPLPHEAAVDDMQMQVGSRTIRGAIKRREEARAIYEAARNAGHIASLLDQERPNIFTQSVANIMPGEQVNITIRYVETVPYDSGTYQFTFPMVVGPRYIPASVEDAGRITPPVTPPGTRAGHDITMEVALDAGVPLEMIDSPTHAVDIAKTEPSRATIRLKDEAVLPNKDFILRYDVAGRTIRDTLLAHNAGKGGFFTLILQPPDRVAPQELTPRELIFVLDSSGSMSGFPIEKAKEVIRLALNGLNPRDTFNLITFSGDEHILFDAPVPATPENLRQALEFLESRRGSGGTEMMKAIRAALDPSDRQDHLRIACFLTDGEVGNDLEIIAEVKKHPNARVFAFGIGSSVNRFLLDGMAQYGRGEVEYVGLNDDGSAAARRFYERVRSPLLTDISIDWNGLPVTAVYPQRIPDLFAAKPLVICGRYQGALHGIAHLRGKVAGRPFERDIQVNLPDKEPRHDVLATLWARRKVADLVSQDFLGIQRGAVQNDLREQITQLGLDYRLMTQYTSFVAVEETTITEGGQPRRIEVPVEMPQGMSYEGVFGSQEVASKMAFSNNGPISARQMASPGFVGGVAPARRPVPVPPAVPAQPVKLDPRLNTLQAGTPAEVEIWLTDTSSQTIQKLKNLGIQIIAQPKGTTLVIAKVDPSKFQLLAQLTEVRYVTPVK